MTGWDVESSVKVKGWLLHEAWITLSEEYVASTYCTVTVSPALALGPVPTMRSELSSLVGGDPGGTVTVGSVPNLPAGDRSWAGMVPAVVAGVVVALGALVVVDVDDELPQAARPRAEADRTTSDQVRMRDIEWVSFRGGVAMTAGSRRIWMQTVVGGRPPG
jgi:hypothetical protein